MSSSTTQAHPTSIAVWDVPSPVVVKGSFAVKVGMKCQESCPLTGQRIVVYNDAETPVGEGRLGETPWPGTSGLYAEDITLSAPAAEGVYVWTVSFTAPLDAPHASASAPFTFRVARPPEHRFTLTVIDRDTQASVANSQVRLGIYRSSTDEDGLARIDVPKGHYELDVRRVGYETISRPVDVSQDIALQVEVVSTPDRDTDDERVWM